MIEHNRWPLHYSLLIVMLVGSTGCYPDNSIELLEVSTVQPTEIEEGSRIQIFGSGFPAGRICEVHFIGQLKHFIDKKERVDLKFKALAVSEQEVQLQISTDNLDQFSGANGFEGRIGVSFPSWTGAARVTGTSSKVRISFLQPTAKGLSERQLHSERAQQFATFIGIDWIERDSPATGVIVQKVQPEGRAALSGLLKNDVVIGFNGSPVDASEDITPPEDSSGVRLRVVRKGYADPFDVWIPIPDFFEHGLDTTSWQLIFSVVFVLSCVFFVSPLSHILWQPFAAIAPGFNSLSVRESQPDQLIWMWVLLENRKKTRRRISWYRKIESSILLYLSPLLASMLLIGLVNSNRLWSVSCDPLLLYLFPFILCISYLLFFATKGDLSKRLKKAVRCCFIMALICIPIISIWITTGTRFLDRIVASQGAWPWQWSFFNHPAQLINLPLFLAGSVHCADWLAKMTRKPTPYTNLVVLLYCACSCGLGTALFLGGWQTGSLPMIGQVESTAMGTLLFVVKSWALGVLVRTARKGHFGMSIANITIGCLLLGSIGITILWRSIHPSAQLILATGYTMFISFSLAQLTAVFRLFTQRYPKSTTVTHMNPFR